MLCVLAFVGDGGTKEVLDLKVSEALNCHEIILIDTSLKTRGGSMA